MPQSSLSRRKGLLVLGALRVLAFGLTRGVNRPSGAPAVARACPPGFVSGSEQASAAVRERRAEVNGSRVRPSAPENETPARWRRTSAPERVSDLTAAQTDSGRRARGVRAS